MRKLLLTLLLVLALAAPASGGEWVNVTVRDQNVVPVPPTAPPPIDDRLRNGMDVVREATVRPVGPPLPGPSIGGREHLYRIQPFRPSTGDRLRNGMDAVREAIVKPVGPPSPVPSIGGREHFYSIRPVGPPSPVPSIGGREHLYSAQPFRPSTSDRLKNGMDAVREAIVRPVGPPDNRSGDGVFEKAHGRLTDGWSALRGR